MLSTHPYTDNIRGNRGRFQGCVVVSTQLSGSNCGARTSLPTQQHTPATVQIAMPAPRDPTTTKNAHSNSSPMTVQFWVPAPAYPRHHHKKRRPELRRRTTRYTLACEGSGNSTCDGSVLGVNCWVMSEAEDVPTIQVLGSILVFNFE